MDRGQRQSRRALRGNVVFVAFAALALPPVKVLFPSVPLWILLTVLALCCFGLVGDLINIFRKPKG
jgi:hypothetical protein